jgi:ammonia channel protein AmtB
MDKFSPADVSTNGVVTPQQVADALSGLALSLDQAFVLLSGYLVFMMQAGFAMLTAGSVRTKNTKNVLLKNVLDACVGAIAYFLFGYAFAYGPGGNKYVPSVNTPFMEILSSYLLTSSLVLFQVYWQW